MIPKAQSLYLDAVRVLCAFGVLFWHASQPPISDGAFTAFPGHHFVIVFFVLSGFVIASTAERPDCTWKNYAADRISRLSCVVIPGLLLTYGLDSLGEHFLPEVYSLVSPDHQFLRFCFNFFYLQQHWFLCTNPSSNQPFWSIAYEFWYYVIFATWIFIRRSRLKWLALVLISLFIGPKIMLLLPCWLAGCATYYCCKCRFQIPKKLQWVFFVASLVAIICILYSPKSFGMDNGRSGRWPLYHSFNFIADNIFAVIVAFNFWTAGQILTSKTDIAGASLIRWASHRTFSLYLYHVPILWCIRALTNYDIHKPLSVFCAIVGCLVVVAGVSEFTEQYYPQLRKLTRAVFQRFRPLAVTAKSVRLSE